MPSPGLSLPKRDDSRDDSHDYGKDGGVGYAVQTAANGGSKLLIFVAPGASYRTQASDELVAVGVLIIASGRAETACVDERTPGEVG
jgi:hypothetical protein